MAGAVPLLLAYLRGHNGSTKMGEAGNAVFDTLTQTIPGTAVSLLALIALAWCVRHLSFEAMAYRPGRIEVPAFGSGPGIEANAEHLTTVFRQRLAVLSLSAPTPVPGAGGDGDFLDVLGREKLDPTNLAGSLVGLMRVAKPNHTWQVTGLLVQRDLAPRYGVTLQVAQLPRGANPPHTIWADSFELAARRAADHATAAILPRTRHCREPWSAWKRLLLPGELLSAHENGVGLEAERRYDEALDAFYHASALDPMNMALRLKIGQLQEKVGLYLDALMTYEGIINVCKQAPKWRPGAYPLAARSQRRRSLLAARYRRIVLLGGAELTRQWRRTGPSELGRWSARDERRRELRSRLRRPLHEQLVEVAERHEGATLLADPGQVQLVDSLRRCGTMAPEDLLAEPSPTGDDATEHQLRELLALLALDELAAMPFLRLRFLYRKLQLTPEAVRLTQMCIKVRLAWLQAQLAPGDKDVCWPPRPARLEDRIHKLEGRYSFGRWHEHYNAACAYALPLTAEHNEKHEIPKRLTNELADMAVERLARATSCADSGYIAGRREWLISEDPDLDGLREHQRFREFEAMYFPSERATPPRPRSVRELESARYIRDLLAATATRWEREWHRRGRDLGWPDIHVMLDWWRTELRAWELVRQVAVDQRHWPARLGLITAMHEWALAYGFAPLAVAFHRYEDEPLCGPDGRLTCGDADEPAKRAEQRLLDVHECLSDVGSQERARQLLGSLEQWQSTLRQLDTEGKDPDRVLLALMCDRHAALWQLLQQWLREDDPDHQLACRTAFEDLVSIHDQTIAERAGVLAATNGRAQQRGGTRRFDPAPQRH